MSNLPGELLLNAIVSATSVTLAAPYIKADALARVLATKQPLTRLVCVTRWSAHDIAVGASDTVCRSMVLEAGGTFLLHPSLHAKFYRLGDAVLVGSANLTYPGLGWSSYSNLEILCSPSYSFDAAAFERRLISEAREISEAEFQVWDSIAKNGPIDIRVSIEGSDPLQDWRPHTRDPLSLEFAYRGMEDRIASTDELQRARSDLTSLAIPMDLPAAEFRQWVTAGLLSSRFAVACIGLPTSADQVAAARNIAREFGIRIGEARRDIETVQNWLLHFAPQLLSS